MSESYALFSFVGWLVFLIFWIAIIVTGRQILERLRRAVVVEEHLSTQIHSLGEILKCLADRTGPLSHGAAAPAGEILQK